MLRATASRLMNETSYAEADLARAFEIDPTHDLVISNVLAWGPQRCNRSQRPVFLMASSEDHDSLTLALCVLELTGTSIVSRMRVRERMYEGWVAWRGRCALELIIRRDGIDTAFELDPVASHPIAWRAWSAAEIAIEIDTPDWSL